MPEEPAAPNSVPENNYSLPISNDIRTAGENKDFNPSAGNTPPGPAAAPGEQEGFMAVLKATFSVVKKKFFLFLGLTILNFILLGGLGAGLLFVVIANASNLGFGGTAGLSALFGILVVFINYLFYGTMSMQAAAAIHDQTLPLGRAFSTVLKNTGKSINVVWKMFMYSGLWVILFILILFPLANTLAFSMGGASMGLLLTVVNFGLGLAGLLCAVIAVIRVIRVTLAFPTLMAQPELTAKQAVDQSVEITKGKWWLMFSFITVFTFLLALIPFAVNLASALSGVGMIQIISMVVTVIFGILSYSINISFGQVMADKLGDKTKMMKLNPGVLIGALIIFFAPMILSVVLPYFGLMSLQNQISSLNTNTPLITETPQSSQELSPQNAALAKENDRKRIENLNAILGAIENYNLQSGSYPNASHCIDDFFTEKFPYLANFTPPNNIDYLMFSGDLGNHNVGCSTPVYQYFDNGKFALYLTVEDPSDGNADKIFASLDEAAQFQPQTSGKYYVIVHLQPVVPPASQEQTQEVMPPAGQTPTTLAAPSAPTAPVKVKRVVAPAGE